MQHFELKGWDNEFQPLASTYHYRDPLIYAEMRKIIGTQVMKQVAQCLKNYLCYSVQIDGSTDKQQQVDSKFIFLFSNVALEAVQSEVPELSVRMSSVLAVSKFFRTSPRRMKMVHKVLDTECITTELVIRIDNRPYIKFS